MLHRFGLDFTSGKTDLCRHPEGCVQSILKYSVGSFLMGYSVTAAIDILVLLLKQTKAIKQNPSIILYTLISKKNVRFASFPALYVLVMRSLTCILRRVLKKDGGVVSFVSGFVGGLLSLWIRE